MPDPNPASRSYRKHSYSLTLSILLFSFILLAISTQISDISTISIISNLSRSFKLPFAIPILRAPETTPKVIVKRSNHFSMAKGKGDENDPRWNALAEGMDYYHNHFRHEFNRVYKLADGSFHKEGMSLPRFLREAQQLSSHLDMHHRIEAHIFPLLAKRMPQFKAGARESGEHLKSHKAIHDGLDKYVEFLRDATADNSKYSFATLREIMDGFREVLFRHLDEEVHDIGKDSLQAAGFTLAELRAIPM